MTRSTDRYPVPVSDPMARLEERLRLLEQLVAEQDRRNPLNNGVFHGTLRNVDAAGNTLVEISPTGIAITEGSIEVGGGTVRALDLVRGATAVSNASLTTSEQFFGSTVLDVPSWAVEAQVSVWVYFQMTNTSGAAQHMLFRPEVEGFPNTGAWSHGVPIGLDATTSALHTSTLTAGVNLGSTVTVRSMARVGTGTNASNAIHVKALAFFTR